MALTRRQREVLDVIREFIAAHGYSPSLEEIGGQLGLSSVATVHKHVTHLVEKGFLRRGWNQNRSIEIVERAAGDGTVPVPLVGAVQLGGFRETAQAEMLLAPAELVAGRGTVHAVRVVGEALAEDQVADGDVIFMERGKAPRDGEPVLACLDGVRPCLRRYYAVRERVRLVPCRGGAEPLDLSPSRVEVHGVVLGLVRKY